MADRPLVTESSQVHPSVPFFLFRVPRNISRSTPFSAELPTQGLVPLRDITERVHLIRGLSKSPLRAAHRFSQPLDGLLRAPASRAYCIPQPRPGFVLFRGVSLRAAPPPSSEGDCPHAVSTLCAHRPKPAATPSAPQLRGFAPHEAAFATVWG